MSVGRVVWPAVLLAACVCSWLVAEALAGESPVRAAALGGESLDRPLVSLDRLGGGSGASEVVEAAESIVAELAVPPSTPSCMVATIDGEVVASTGADTLLIPGSAQMLVTGWAALAVLGPDFRFTTSVRSESQVSDDGVVAGSLFLFGGGDPVLMTADWARANRPAHTVLTDPAVLADAVVDAGVASVFGAVIGVDSRYDDQRAMPGLDAASSIETSVTIGPLGALRINAGSLPADNLTSVDLANPAATAAASFDDLLEARGVLIAGLSRAVPSNDELPELIEIASLTSPPLSAIVNQMLDENDAAIAELLLKELGFAAGGDGSTAAGAQQVLAVVRERLDVDFAAPPRSGSGLDSIGTSTCELMAAFVAAIDQDSMVTSVSAGYQSAALGERPEDALVVRGELATTISLVARADVGPDPLSSSGPEVIIVSMLNELDATSSDGRDYVQELIRSIDELRAVSAQAGGG